MRLIAEQGNCTIDLVPHSDSDPQVSVDTVDSAGENQIGVHGQSVLFLTEPNSQIASTGVLVK